MAGKDTASLDTGAGAKAANVAVDDLSDVIRALDKKAQGEYPPEARRRRHEEDTDRLPSPCG